MSGSMHQWSSEFVLDDDNDSVHSVIFSDTSADDHIRSPDVCRRLYTLFREQLYTDVKFILKSGKTPYPTLQAHKAILAIGSDKFKEILFDSNPKYNTNEITIKDIPFNTFKTVVEFLYTDDINFDSDEAVLEILFTAQKFEIQSLISKCESHIASVQITEENVCSKFRLANDFRLTSLKNRCSEFIQENTGTVLRSTDFLQANTETVYSICQMERFNLRSELELLSGIVRWAEARSNSKTNKRVIVEPFLKQLRLLTSSCADFNQFVQNHQNLFTAPETANILMALSGSPNLAPNLAPNLPRWCKGGSNRCTTAPRPRERRENIYSMKKLHLALKPSDSNQYLSSLTCVLELKCTRGSYKIDGLKLSFDNPVNKLSVIEQMVFHIGVTPGTFGFQENLHIENSKDIEMRFTRPLLLKSRQTLRIKAEARDVQNYKFLSFDENIGFSEDSPFICTLGSAPKHNRLFFISEINYQNHLSSDRRRNQGQPHRRPRN